MATRRPQSPVGQKQPCRAHEPHRGENKAFLMCHLMHRKGWSLLSRQRKVGKREQNKLPGALAEGGGRASTACGPLPAPSLSLSLPALRALREGTGGVRAPAGSPAPVKAASGRGRLSSVPRGACAEPLQGPEPHRVATGTWGCAGSRSDRAGCVPTRAQVWGGPGLRRGTGRTGRGLPSPSLRAVRAARCISDLRCEGGEGEPHFAWALPAPLWQTAPSRLAQGEIFMFITTLP